MRTMRADLARKLNQAGDRNPETEPTERPHRPGWGELLKAAVVVYVAGAAQRVLSRPVPSPAPVPEAGRRGGEVRAIPAGAFPLPQEHAREEDNRTARPSHAEEPAPAPTGVLAIARATFREFGQDNGTLMAASVAFYLLLSIVPLVLVGIAVFGFFMTDPDAQGRVLEFTNRFMPGRSGILQDMVLSAKEARQGLVGVGLGALLFTALGGFSALETAINITWGTPSRNFLMNKLFSLAMLLLIGSLLVLTVGISSVMAWARTIPGISWLTDNLLAAVLGFTLPILISAAMFTFIYKLFPNRKVEWKPAAIAGVVTAVLWEAFKHGYQWYSASQFSNQEATYGVAAGFVGLILWIYYSSALVLLGSELTWVLQGCPRDGETPTEPSPA
jgi:membrane protein